MKSIYYVCFCLAALCCLSFSTSMQANPVDLFSSSVDESEERCAAAIDFTFTPNQFNPCSYTFNVTFSSGRGRYHWNFGDGGPGAFGTRVNRSFQADGQYDVCLTKSNTGEQVCKTVTAANCVPIIVNPNPGPIIIFNSGGWLDRYCRDNPESIICQGVCRDENGIIIPCVGGDENGDCRILSGNSLSTMDLKDPQKCTYDFSIVSASLSTCGPITHIWTLDNNYVKNTGEANSVRFNIPTPGTHSLRLTRKSNSTGVTKNNTYSFVTDCSNLLGDDNALKININDYFNIYPNPVQHSFTLDYQLPELSSTATMTLVNAQGQTVMVENLNGGTTNQQFDVTQLPRGIYFVQVQSAEGLLYQSKVVVNN